MEDQAPYMNQSRGMTADQWHDAIVKLFDRLPKVIAVIASEKMRQRVKQVTDNIENAADVVYQCAEDSAALIVEGFAEVLDEAYGETLPTVSSRGLDATHDAVIQEVKNALTLPDYHSRYLVQAMRPLKDEETGNLFED